MTVSASTMGPCSQGHRPLRLASSRLRPELHLGCGGGTARSGSNWGVQPLYNPYEQPFLSGRRGT